MSENSFENLLARLDAQDQDAATELFHRFSNRLISLARNRLSSRLRQKVDPEDIAQSVFRSFFRRRGEGEFEFADWGGLWGLLVTITLRKCGRQVEAFYAERRNILRESNLTSRGDGESSTGWDPQSPEPTPLEAATLAETVEQAMSELSERERNVFRLRLQGYTVPEIAAQIGRVERTIQRDLDRIRQNLAQQMAKGADA